MDGEALALSDTVRGFSCKGCSDEVDVILDAPLNVNLCTVFAGIKVGFER